MNNTVFIKGLRIYAYHGVLPQEQVVGSYFTIDISINTDFSKAIFDDDLNGTINYAEVLNIIKREMAIPSKLMEHVAGRIISSVFHQIESAQHIRLQITKENPPMGADCKGAGIEIEQSRTL